MHHQPIGTERLFRHSHLACRIGGAVKGFNMANPRAGKVQSAFGLDEFDLSLVRGTDR